MNELTELTAAAVYAEAWNRLDASELIELLGPETVYESQWVFAALEGKEAVAEYLSGKMATLRAAGDPAKVRAELGRTTRGFPDRACVILTQGHANDVTAVMLFEVAGPHIKRMDLCIPDLLSPVGSGEVPV